MQKPIFLHATDSQKVLQGLDGCSTFQVQQLTLFDVVHLNPEVVLTDIIVISSKKTVDWLRQNPSVVEELKTKKIFVVGTETAKGLNKCGLSPQFVSTSGFQGLTEYLTTCQIGTILGATKLAQPTKDWLKRHSEWKHIAVYQTIVKTDVEIQHVDRLQVALITSPKIAEAFYNIGVPKNILVITLGETTANACYKLGFQDVVIGKDTILKTCQWFVRNQETLLHNKGNGRI